MRSFNNGVWYWRKNDSGMIYKYPVGKYPLNHAADYKRVSSAEYAEQLEFMMRKYLDK